jgi:hypothetical protein
MEKNINEKTIGLDLICTNENDDSAMMFFKLTDENRLEIVKRIGLAKDLKKKDHSFTAMHYYDSRPKYFWGSLDFFESEYESKDNKYLLEKAELSIKKEDYPFRAKDSIMVVDDDSIYWSTYHKHGNGTKWESECLYLSDILNNKEIN